MIKYIIYFYLLIQAFGISQELPEYIRAESKFIPESTIEEGYRHKLSRVQEYGEVEFRKYDVLKYDYELDLTQALNSNLEDEVATRKYFHGTNTVTLKMLENTDQLEFDAAMSKISDVTIDGQPVGFTHSKDENLLTVMIGDVTEGQELSIKIDFEGTGDSFNNYRSNRGMHIYHKGQYFNENLGELQVFTEHNIAYTMSEPELARYWIPSNDRPYEKSLSSMRITVPKGYNVASNGELVEVLEVDDNKSIYHWENNDPITTYLMNFAVSIFSEHHQEAITENDTIPMVHYFWEQDRAGDVFKLEASMDTHPNMMKILTEKYGPYPFNKYGTATVYPFPYGGMEHQTMVTQHRYWILDRGDVGFVHEMGHHWFGDLITCATWADIWINEGGATITEAIYANELYGIEGYNNSIRGKINFYFKRNSNNSGSPIYAVPLNRFFGADSYLIYDKAAIVMHLLKQNIGDEQFYRILNEIFEEWKYKSITTAEFLKEWTDRTESSLVDMDLFFDQWVYGAGHPEYTIESKLNQVVEDEYQFNIKLKQIHSEVIGINGLVPDVFVTPIRIITESESRSDTTEILINDKIEQDFSLNLDYIPTDIYLDEMTTLHKLSESIITSAETDVHFSDMQLYPNPVSSGYSNLYVPIENTTTNLNIQLVDLQGNVVNEIFEGINDGKNINYMINTNNLATGIYFVVIDLNGSKQLKKLIVN